MTASDDLTPEVLARIEARARNFYSYGLDANELIELDIPALLSGVRSRDARIVELEQRAAEAEAVIAETPHADACSRQNPFFNSQSPAPCDCWKSRYPAGAEQ